MRKIRYSDYTGIWICYRIFFIILATCVYFVSALRVNEFTVKKVVVAAGMLLACFLGTFLYKVMLEQETKAVWIYTMITVEVFTHGIFIWLSGGFYSPYLWYCIGCLFLPMSMNLCMPVMFLAVAWYLLCTVASRLLTGGRSGPAGLEINTAVGVMAVLGGFYILNVYIRKLSDNQNKMEQALNHINDLYDSFHLFAMSDITKIMEQLMRIISRSIAADGGILVKLDEEGNAEWYQAVGMSPDLLTGMADWGMEPTRQKNRCRLRIDHQDYDIWQFGIAPLYSGMLIRPLLKESPDELRTDSFHYKLIDTVFKNIDVQRQLEDYITGEEQRRMADEIHDTVIQKLFGIACKIKVLEQSGADLPLQSPGQELAALREAVESAMKELREAIYGKRFSDHDKQFYEKLKTYMSEVEKLWDIRITINMDQDAEILSASQKLAIYKTVCEAVNNAIRHAAAKVVQIEIALGKEGITTIITDNGSGFTSGGKQNGVREGNGLKNMQRLATAFKGSCMVESKPGRGTQIKLYLPR